MLKVDDLDTQRVSLINYVTRIQFGYGAAQLLPEELARLKVHRPLLITDKGVLQAGVLQCLPPVDWARTFSETPSNPTEPSVRVSLAQYRAARCDGIVAFGGGSPIDLAKALAVSVNHPGPLADYALVNGGLEKISGTIPPIVAIPTTAGTGSEIARATVVIMDDGTKRVIANPALVPKVALCDPALTLSLPPYMTAATGFDAIAHCVETYCAPTVNPPADAIALDGLRRALDHVRTATEQPGDRQARWHMLMSSLQGGMTFQKGLGAVHALSHPLGELGLHHGTLNAVLLPHVLRHNEPFIRNKLSHVRDYLGLPAGQELADKLEHLMIELRLPTRLSQLGVRRDQFAQIARKAEHDTCSATNPVPMDSAAYEGLLEAAF